MNKLIWLFAILGVVSFGSSLRAEPLYLANFDVTDVCKEHLDEQNITTFKIWDDDAKDPVLVNRNPEVQVKITDIWFAPFLYGWLIQANEQKVVHCLTGTSSFLNFGLAERRSRYLIFDQGPIDVTEVHLHSFVGCGTACHFARVETVIFFDKIGMHPMYDHVEDTIPNEYPSRWFSNYLDTEELRLFDKVL